MKKIMIIEDDTIISKELYELLVNAGYEALILKDFSNAKEEILKTMLKYGAVKLEHNPTEEDYVKNDGGDINSHYMKFMLKGVKIEFFTPILNILPDK